MNQLFLKTVAILIIAALCSSSASTALAAEPQKASAKQEKKSEDDLTLKDIGFTSKELKGDPEKQRKLESRASKLKMHQILGLVTLGLMTATVLTAEENSVPAAHKTLGIATGVSYFTTAYFSLSAPEVNENEKDAWNVKLHKALAWVHFPLMILTPIAGILAERQIERGESLHGLAKAKSALGVATLATFAPAAAVMVIEF